MRTQMLNARLPEDYDGLELCPRCGDGFVICASKMPDGRTFTHDETCRRYRWGDLCIFCELVMETEYGREKDAKQRAE